MNEELQRALMKYAAQRHPTFDAIDVSESDGVITITGYDVEPAGVCGDPRNGPTFSGKLLGTLRWETPDNRV
mgnify:CR=1 FL=1